jgi:diphthamide biosynthesis protein 2
MTSALSAPPVLATPDTHILEEPTPISNPLHEPVLSREQLIEVYEIQRTAREIHQGGWRRIALQFPDGMLRDASRVFDLLQEELRATSPLPVEGQEKTATKEESLEKSFNGLNTDDAQDRSKVRHRLHILADTSYGACCVDEIAAEHADAEVVVHYGRSCLSPTARLPVIYVFTSRPLALDPVVEVFQNTYPSKQEKIILMADIIYHGHVAGVLNKLRGSGYTNITAPDIIHDPASIIPNRKVDIDGDGDIKEYSLFHISDPPPALLLTLSSRVKDFSIYPRISATSTTPQKALQSNTSMALRRRYALLTSLSTCPVFGILINTLSVKNYLETVADIKAMIERAGKKSYTFVVGKVNAAKVANFSEVGGWVVIGCWESSLVESTEFYRPIITPFELSLTLMSDAERVWSGEWRGDFASLDIKGKEFSSQKNLDIETIENGQEGEISRDLDSEEESEPPEFDLRTGRYVSHSRPLRNTAASIQVADSTKEEEEGNANAASNVLTRRAKGDLATINGTVSPGAEYLRTQRTWQGLGSDFKDEEEAASTAVHEGRTGVARGYRDGEDVDRR